MWNFGVNMRRNGVDVKVIEGVPRIYDGKITISGLFGHKYGRELRAFNGLPGHIYVIEKREPVGNCGRIYGRKLRVFGGANSDISPRF